MQVVQTVQKTGTTTVQFADAGACCSGRFCPQGQQFLAAAMSIQVPLHHLLKGWNAAVAGFAILVEPLAKTAVARVCRRWHQGLVIGKEDVFQLPYPANVIDLNRQ